MSQSSDRVFVFLEIFSQEGGIQSYIKDVLQAYHSLPNLAQTDIFILRDAADCPNPLRSDSITYHYLKTSSPRLDRLRLAWSLVQILLLARPQHLYCGHVNLAPLVRLLCQPLGISYTVLTYGKEVWEPLTQAQKQATRGRASAPKDWANEVWEPLTEGQKQALQQADCIWTISRYSRDVVCQYNDINPQKVKILPCVVDGNRFNIAPKPLDLVNKYQIEDAQVLMTVARLWSEDIYKGVDVTLRALPKILTVHPRVKYLIIGRGDDQPRLLQLAQDLGVGDRVIFAGFVKNEDLVAHYHLASAYIMPSQEGFGIVYLEAMACGVPVLSGDSDGSADPLQDGKLGWRVPHREPDAVANACIEILAASDRRCQGQWLREETLKVFGQEKLAEKLGILMGF